jgi:hypothetical protein
MLNFADLPPQALADFGLFTTYLKASFVTVVNRGAENEEGETQTLDNFNIDTAISPLDRTTSLQEVVEQQSSWSHRTLVAKPRPKPKPSSPQPGPDSYNLHVGMDLVADNVWAMELESEDET